MLQPHSVSASDILNDVLLEHIHDNVTVTDSNGILLRVSNSCERNFNFCSDEYIGKPIALMEEHGIFNPSISMVVLREKKKITTTQVDGAGCCRPITGIPVFDEKSKLRYVVCFTSWDISSLEELQTEQARLKKELERSTAEARYLRAKEHSHSGVMAESPVTRALHRTVMQVAPYRVNALIQGPRGAGKSFYARLLHGGPEAGPFIEFNCSTVQEAQVDQELFGNCIRPNAAGGDNTGPAAEGRMGALELAAGGTLYISDLDALPAFAQIGLAGVISAAAKHKVLPCRDGATTILPRIIGSTDKDVKQLIAAGTLREELFYCISPVHLKVPPLQERTEDLTAFILHFLVEKNAEYGLSKSISPKALERLQKYAWPGNIREVRSVVEHLLLTSTSSSIELADLDEEHLGTPRPAAGKAGFSLRDALEHHEKQIILQACVEHKTTTALAKALGISQPSVVRKLAKYKKTRV